MIYIAKIDVKGRFNYSYEEDREKRKSMTGPNNGIHPLAKSWIHGKGLKTELRETDFRTNNFEKTIFFFCLRQSPATCSGCVHENPPICSGYFSLHMYRYCRIEVILNFLVDYISFSFFLKCFHSRTLLSSYEQ